MYKNTQWAIKYEVGTNLTPTLITSENRSVLCKCWVIKV